MPKISKEQIQEIKRRPSAESVVPDLPSECAGSYQELGYYRHGVKRAECLMPYWDKINYFDLPGIDLDFHNKIEDYKRILKAADALTRLKMRLASKSFNAKLIITDKIAPETDDLKSIFAIIKELPGNLDFHGLPCYEEALRAFCKFELGGFFSYLSDIIGLDSFLSFKQACRNCTNCENQGEISQRFTALKESYSSFVDDIRACEDGKMSIGFGEADDAKINFEDIYGELKNTEGDFGWIIRTLKSMPDNQDYESDLKDERGCLFNVNIDPRHNPFAYATKSLRLYHYCSKESTPGEIEDLINHLADLWDDMFTLLGKKFNFLDNEVETARNAFETFMDFISDADEYTPGDTACEVIRKTNIQNVETTMTTIAKALERSHVKKTKPTNNTCLQSTIDWVRQSWDSFVGISLSGLNDIYDNPASTVAAPVRYQFLQPIFQNGSINPAIRYFNVDDISNILNSLQALAEESPDEFLNIHQSIFEKYTQNWQHLLFDTLPLYFPGEPVIAELQTTFNTLRHLIGDFGMTEVNTTVDKWEITYKTSFNKFCDLLNQLSVLQFKHDNKFIRDAAKRKETLESPLTQKYFAWGAESIDDLPIDALKVRKNELPKIPFEQNLKVKANTADELISTLNKNVSDYFSGIKRHLHNTMDDCYRNGSISNIDPIKVLHDDLIETVNELTGKNFPKHKDQWAPLLAEILGLPSTTVHYYFWHDPDEGPTEPGLQYELRDGTKEEVFYDSRLTDWYDKIRELESTIDAFINEALRCSQEAKSQKLIDEWIDIKAKWEQIFDKHDNRHSAGDLIGFASAFHEGVVRFCTAFPTLESEMEESDTSPVNEGLQIEMPTHKSIEHLTCLHKELSAKGVTLDSIIASKTFCDAIASLFIQTGNPAYILSEFDADSANKLWYLIRVKLISLLTANKDSTSNPYRIFAQNLKDQHLFKITEPLKSDKHGHEKLRVEVTKELFSSFVNPAHLKSHTPTTTTVNPMATNKRGRKSGRTGDAYDQFVAAKELYEDPQSTFYHNANGAATNVLGWIGTAKNGHYQHALKGYSRCGTYEGVKSLAKRLLRTCNPSDTKQKPGRKLKGHK